MPTCNYCNHDVGPSAILCPKCGQPNPADPQGYSSNSVNRLADPAGDGTGELIVWTIITCLWGIPAWLFGSLAIYLNSARYFTPLSIGTSATWGLAFGLVSALYGVLKHINGQRSRNEWNQTRGNLNALGKWWMSSLMSALTTLALCLAILFASWLWWKST
jgi:hypothetical protein